MTFADVLARGTVVSDGAWGTELAGKDLPPGVPESWNLNSPDAVAQVAADYAAAGADIVLTNTFGGTSIKLNKAGLEDHDEINRIGAALSRQGVGDKALVFASVGPTGELIGLTSKLTEDELEAVFAAQARAILQGDPDGFVIETMADLTETKCALRGIKSITDLPVVASNTYDEGARGAASMMGLTPAQAAVELTEAGADVIGANCGRLSEDAWVQVVSDLCANTDRPVWAKANAGIPELVAGESVFPMSPEDFAGLGTRLIAAGAKFVGGCCGTTPAHIRALAAAVK